ncbi:conjugal transfer protein TraH [Sutterella sp.]|uniref:conjugal transfer protein TraH n=1 Tax=Sutterella sp. TaxID=1981025 RepID=UPI003FD7A443
MLTIKPRVIALALAGAIALSSMPLANAAGLQAKMDTVFGDMSNVSRPGIFDTQRRGVLSGGSAYVRSRIMNTELVNLQTPSWKAGCGGIDFFGGSFSFINADQFVQLLRTVAANAKGYAFQLALDAACPSCMAWINNLQAKIQQLNEAFGNSCQLAQGLVADTARAMGSTRDFDYSLTGTVQGLYDDFFGARSQADGKDTKKQVTASGKDENLVGNIIWESLKKSNAKGWIVDASNEKDEYGIIMAVTGTIIIPKPADDANNPDTGTSNNPNYLPALIDFKDLLDGGTLKTYTCNDDTCLNPTTTSITTVGMVKRIRDALVGDGTSRGVIAKFGEMSDNAFTAKEANLMANMPASIGSIVRNLATSAPDVARDQAYDLAYAVAMSWAHDLIQENLKVARQAVRTNSKPEVREMLQMLNDREASLNRSYEKYAKDHPTLAKMVEQYNAVQKNIYKIAVVAANTSSQPGASR